MITALFCKSANGFVPAKSSAIKNRSVARASALTARTLLALAVALPLTVSAGTKVAFIADQGVGEDSRDVLALIREEGADIVLSQGDFGYNPNTATQWEDNLNSELGRNFPVLSVVGNHENYEWPLYKNYIQQRVGRVGGLNCSGNIGVKASCTFENIQVVQVAPGIREVPGVEPEDNYDGYIRSAFNNDSDRWRICAWHKNQTKVQPYNKSSETGWLVFDACLNAGAMVAMGHAHSYSRTFLLSDYASQTVANRDNDMLLQPGRSFAFVSGLGGRDIRPQRTEGDWFASIYTATQGATHGALFCTFEPDTADCYFKAINGAIPDRFTLRRSSQPADPSGPSNDSPVGGLFSRSDKTEFWWIAPDSSGRLTKRWVSQSCASRLGSVRYNGDWGELQSIASRVNRESDPCDGSTVPASEPPSPPNPSAGFVFSRSDTTELRWIDTNSNGQLGSIWIDEACAVRLGGTSVTGDWAALIELAPGFDTIPSPCRSAGGNGGGTADPSGYVFSRTDKTEYRWIGTDSSGAVGNIWINKACSDSLGGPTATGTWFDLNAIAPGFDAIASPC